MTSHTETATYPLADLSATQRDLLWILSQIGPSESRPLHYTLADYYTDGIDHSRICDILGELVERDLVTELPHDTTEYRLTETARRALSARQAWEAGTHNAEGRNE